MMLVVRVGAVDHAVPIAHVVETMRPLPLVADPGLPPDGALRGTAIVRGAPIPIVDAARLAGAASAPSRLPTRLVVLRAGEARVGLLVDAVLGVREVTTGVSGLAADVPGLPPALAAAIASARRVAGPP